VKLLLDKGADLEWKDYNTSWTPLLVAVENEHEGVVKLLLDKGGVSLESKNNEHGRTPLLWAARNGHEAVVKLLLDKGADLESKDI
ncbi:ankyrin, partial [Periconia macrospinosa]